MNDWVKQIELLRVENEGLREMIYLAEMTRWNNEQEGWISTAKKALEVKE